MRYVRCLQSTDSNQKYARWCQHNGKDMFIIDCIPGKRKTTTSNYVCSNG